MSDNPDQPQITEYCVHVSLTDWQGIRRNFTMQIPAVSKAAAEQTALLTIKRRSRIQPREIHYIQA